VISALLRGPESEVGVLNMFTVLNDLFLICLEFLLILLSILVELGSYDEAESDEAGKVDGHGETDLPVVG